MNRVLNEQPEEKEKEEVVPSEVLVVFFLLLALSVGTLARLINKKTGLSTSALTFLSGLIMAVSIQHHHGLVKESLEVVARLSSAGLMSVFLPVLSFYNAFTLDYSTFRKQLKPIAALAVPATLVNALLLTLAIKILYQNEPYSWPAAFVLASVLSATDGFATVSLVSQAGMSPKFTSLLKCESLFNNAIAYSLVIIGLDLALESISGWNMLLSFFSLNLGGAILGFILGVVVSTVMKRMFNDYIQVTNLTFLVGFISLFLANQVFSPLLLPVSGLMTLLSTGIYMAAFGKSKINPESKHALLTFWEFAVFAAEQTLFMLAGVYSANKLLEESELLSADDLKKLLLLYLFMLIVRYVVLQLHKNILLNHGSKINNSEVTVLWHTGGIRGAISIIFTLMVCETGLPQLVRTLMLFHVVGCVLLSLSLNGITSIPLIRYLGFQDKSRSKNVIFSYFLNGYLNNVAEKKENMKADQFMQVTDWKQVDDLAGVDDVQAKLEKLKKDHAIEAKGEYQMMEKGEYLKNEDELNAELEEARSKSIQCIKGVVHHLYEQNQCSGESSQLLRQVLQDDHDDCSDPMDSWRRLSEQFYQQTSIQTIENMARIPLVGTMMKGIVLNEINKFHDSICTYIIAVQRTLKIVSQLDLCPAVRAVIIKELDDNLQHAEEYYYGYLQYSYAGISKQVQNKKAALSIIDKQMCFAQQKLSEGQITEKEYNKVKAMLDQHVVALENLPLDFQQEPEKQFVQNLPFFRLLKEDQIAALMGRAKTVKLAKDDTLFRLNDPIHFFYVLQNGSALETFSQEGLTYAERKPVGSIVSYLNLFAEGKLYQSSFLAKSEVTLLAFDIKQLRGYVKQNKELESYVYKENMKIMKHISPPLVHEFGHLDSSQLLRLLSCCQYEKMEVGQLIDLSEGGILLRGSLFDYTDDDIQSKNLLENFNFIKRNADNAKDKNSVRNAKFEESLRAQKEEGWHESISVIHPVEAAGFLCSQGGVQDMRQKYQRRQVLATKKSIVFRFTEYEKVHDILTVDELADQVRNSFTRTSAVKARK